jgi:hypothetical protein
MNEEGNRTIQIIIYRQIPPLKCTMHLKTETPCRLGHMHTHEHAHNLREDTRLHLKGFFFFVQIGLNVLSHKLSACLYSCIFCIYYIFVSVCVCLSVCVSVCVSVCLSVCLSV